MGKKKNIKRTLYTLLVMLLLSFASFLTGVVVNRIMLSRIEESFFARTHISLEQQDCNSFEQQEYSEWQR